jgi:hypothetical protein
MHQDLLFETNRFNLSEVKMYFINPCCFGEDVAMWLREKLIQQSVETDEPGQEDWGWYLGSSYQGNHYFIGIGGLPDDDATDPNQGEWRIMVERRRSIADRLTGKNKTTTDDPIFPIIRTILEAEPDIKNVHFEE